MKVAVVEMGDHGERCLQRVVECPNGCKGVRLTRTSLVSHLNVSCLLQTVECPLSHLGCHDKVLRGEVDFHLCESTRHIQLLTTRVADVEQELRARCIEFTRLETAEITHTKEVKKLQAELKVARDENEESKQTIQKLTFDLEKANRERHTYRQDYPPTSDDCIRMFNRAMNR